MAAPLERPAPAGILLLTGGRGRRFGGPKHDQPHPSGGTWGAHLVDVFGAVFPQGPVRVLGEPLPDRPGLDLARDPGQGPAAALVQWAGLAPSGPAPLRWWVAACDQVRWTPESLAAWHARAAEADPDATRWVLARHGDHLQYLGGFLASSLAPALAGAAPGSMRTLVLDAPHAIIDWPADVWLDVDTPGAREAWLAERGNTP